MELPMFYNEEDEWKKVMLIYDSALKEVYTKIEILNNEFKLKHQYNPIEHVTSRLKSPQSIAKKIRHNGIELTVENIVKYINDVAGIRIICSFTSDIYRIADLIAKQSDVQVLKVKDYLICPKSNGYSSYHMIVSVPIYLSNTTVNTKVEIQIRTIAMDFWASLEHKIYYKFEGNAPERIRKELKECADIVGYLDQKMLSLNEEIKEYSKEDYEQQYKESQSANFHNLIKDSYGTVVEEEVIEKEDIVVEKVTYEATGISYEMSTSKDNISKDNMSFNNSSTSMSRNSRSDMEEPELELEACEVKDATTTKVEHSKKKKENEKKSENKYFSFFGLK